MARRGARYQKILDQYFPGAVFSERANTKPINAKAQSRQAANKTTVNAKAQSRQAANKTTVNAKAPSRQAANKTTVNAKAQSPQAAKDEGLNQAFGLASLRFCIFAPTPDLTLSSEHFHISYPHTIPRAEIEAAIRVLEAARLNMFVRVRPASIVLPETKIYLVIHETTQDFVAATGQPWWVAGVTHGARIELQPLEVLSRRHVVRSALRHEYAHAVIEGIGGSGVPRWLIEGLAISFAGEGQSLERFRPRIKLSLDELERRLASPGSDAEMRALYSAAYREVRSLINKDGEAKVWRLVTSKGTVRSEV
jgi:hypothetical protein